MRNFFQRRTGIILSLFTLAILSLPGNAYAAEEGGDITSRKRSAENECLNSGRHIAQCAGMEMDIARFTDKNMERWIADEAKSLEQREHRMIDCQLEMVVMEAELQCEDVSDCRSRLDLIRLYRVEVMLDQLANTLQQLKMWILKLTLAFPMPEIRMNFYNRLFHDRNGCHAVLTDSVANIRTTWLFPSGNEQIEAAKKTEASKKTEIASRQCLEAVVRHSSSIQKMDKTLRNYEKNNAENISLSY